MEGSNLDLVGSITVGQNNATFKPWSVIHQYLNLVAKQQENFPSYVGTLYSYLRITSVSTLVGCGQFKPAQASLV